MQVLKQLRQLIILSFLICNLSNLLSAQSINGLRITVSTDALTVLKFNTHIQRIEVGNVDDYTCKVRDDDNSIVLRTQAKHPDSTNLIVTEGKRTHYFFITFKEKIDINKDKLYYDFSDLKTVKRISEEMNNQSIAMVVTGNGGKTTETKEETKKDEEPPKLSKKEKKRLEQEQKDKDEAEKKQLWAAENAKKEADAKLASDAAEKQKAMALAKAKADEEKNKAVDDKRKADALAKSKADEELKRIADENEKQRIAKVAEAKEAVRQKELATAKEKEIKRMEQEEKDRKVAMDKEIAMAAAKEKQRLQDEEKAKRAAEAKAIADVKEQEKQRLVAEKKAKDQAIADAKEKERTRLQDIANRKKAEQAEALAAAKEKERVRLQEIADKKKAEQDSLLAIAKEKEKIHQAQLEKERLEALDPHQKVSQPYTQAQFFKKYPTIVYNSMGPGQMLTPDFITDSAASRLEAEKVFASKSKHLLVDEDELAAITLERIYFGGASTYLKIHIQNKGKVDFLTGAMLVYWQKADSTVKKLWASYISAFPVVLPGKELDVVFAFHSVNSGNDDLFVFELKDRVKKTSYSIHIPGKLYNEEQDQVESDRGVKAAKKK